MTSLVNVNQLEAYGFQAAVSFFTISVKNELFKEVTSLVNVNQLDDLDVSFL